jgi:hypothetical protein
MYSSTSAYTAATGSWIGTHRVLLCSGCRGRLQLGGAVFPHSTIPGGEDTHGTRGRGFKRKGGGDVARDVPRPDQLRRLSTAFATYI